MAHQQPAFVDERFRYVTFSSLSDGENDAGHSSNVSPRSLSSASSTLTAHPNAASLSSSHSLSSSRLPISAASSPSGEHDLASLSLESHPQQVSPMATASSSQPASANTSPATNLSNMEAVVKKKRGRTGSSKYDFIKTRIWIKNHYYVLSRFVLSRILTTIRIPESAAVRISLDLKKQLVDGGHWDMQQSELEEKHLFELMRARGYGDSYVQLFKMLTRFHHRRIPLMILICGSRASGKSTLATQLAERMNAPYVLQTDIIFELLTGRQHDADDCDRHPGESAEAEAARLEAWKRDADIVFRGIQPEITKCIKDGKTVIMEGLHLQAERVLQAVSGSKGVIVSFLLLRGSARLAVSDWLQDHLLAQMPPKSCTQLRLDEVGVTGALDAMHDRVLSCIQKAVEDLDPS
jgi:2-phosphoglycerate kinase